MKSAIPLFTLIILVSDTTRSESHAYAGQQQKGKCFYELLTLTGTVLTFHKLFEKNDNSYNVDFDGTVGQETNILCLLDV